VILEALNVWKLFGPTVALSDVTLSLERGLHVIAGPNGSGKTTLLKLWAGLIKPSRGRVSTLGIDPYYNRSKLMSRIGVAFEDVALPWWTTAIDYLRFVSERKGARWGDVRELASTLGVDAYWGKSIRSYSSGMRKRVVLLQALIGDPEVLLLDEPYTLLDKSSISRVNAILLKAAREGRAVIVATHIFTDLEYNADSLTILFNGTLAYHGLRDELAREAIYTCRKQEVAGKIDELAREAIEVIVRGDTVIVKMKPGVSLETWGVKCETLVDVRRIYEKTLEVIH